MVGGVEYKSILVFSSDQAEYLTINKLLGFTGLLLFQTSEDLGLFFSLLINTYVSVQLYS